MPMPDGSQWVYTPKQMTDLTQLDYTYDGLSQPAAVVNAAAERLERLGAAAAASRARKGSQVSAGRNIELVGASQSPVEIRGSGARTTVKLDSHVRQRLTASLAAASEAAPPDRVILNLESVRGARDAHVLSVFINLPSGAKPADHPELLAGSVALFGLGEASSDTGPHGGQGLNFSMDITKTIDAMHLNNALDTDSLDISLVPNRVVTPEGKVTVGKISIFRKGR